MATLDTIASMAKQMGGQSIEQIVSSVSCAIIGHKCDTRETLETLKRNKPGLFPFPETQNVRADTEATRKDARAPSPSPRGLYQDDRGASKGRARPSRNGERGWQ